MSNEKPRKFCFIETPEVTLTEFSSSNQEAFEQFIDKNLPNIWSKKLEIFEKKYTRRVYLDVEINTPESIDSGGIIDHINNFWLNIIRIENGVKLVSFDQTGGFSVRFCIDYDDRIKLVFDENQRKENTLLKKP
jgi:hypothetical protein